MKRATHDDVIRHMPVAWAYAHRLMDQPEDAEAAAQDALATVVDELPSLKSKQVRKRLKQEVRAFEAKAALAAAEREKARKLARTRTDTLAKDATNQALLKGWRKETLHAVSELPDQMRRVFTLTALEGRSNADAARVLKLDQKQVARLRKRASRALFDKLSERGGGRTGWVLLLPLFRGLSPGSHTSAWAWFIGVLSVGLVALGWQSFADDKRDAGQSPYADQSIQSGLELSGAADSERKLVLVDAPSPIEPEVNESQAAEAKEEPEKPKLVTPEATKLERSIVTPPTFIEDMRYQQIIEIPDENIRVETVSFQHREGIEWERPKIKSGPFAGELHGIGRRYSQVPTPEGKEWVEAEYLVELGKPLETRVFNMEGDVIKRLFPFSEQVLEVWDLKKEKDGTSRWVRNVSRYVVATNNDHIGAKKIEKADLPVGYLAEGLACFDSRGDADAALEHFDHRARAIASQGRPVGEVYPYTLIEERDEWNTLKAIEQHYLVEAAGGQAPPARRLRVEFHHTNGFVFRTQELNANDNSEYTVAYHADRVNKKSLPRWIIVPTANDKQAWYVVQD